jgi:hypothetical protein
MVSDDLRCDTNRIGRTVGLVLMIVPGTTTNNTMLGNTEQVQYNPSWTAD